MAQVVLGHQPSVYAAYRAMQERLTVSDQAVYDKLRHMEPLVCSALVEHSGQQADALSGSLQATLPPWIPGYRLRILDGTHLGATQHRLQVLRESWAAPLPGQLLAVLEQQTKTISHVVCCQDGHAQERALLAEIYPLVRARDLCPSGSQFLYPGLLVAGGGQESLFHRQTTWFSAG